MVNSHVGHDAWKRNVIANLQRLLAMYLAIVYDWRTLWNTSIVRMGDFVMIAAGKWSPEYSAYCIAQGDRIKLAGINHVGWKSGFFCG